MSFLPRFLCPGLFLLLLGCQSSSALLPDGGPSEAAVPDADLAIAAVNRPVLTAWDCPAGWEKKEITPQGVEPFAICQPPARAVCPLGQVQYIADKSCHAIGTSCPLGSFLPASSIRTLAPGFAGTIRYVKPGATLGDGSEAKPFGTVAEAHKLSAAGDIIALSQGTFVEVILIYKAIALVGACVTGTIIDPPPPDATTEMAVGFAVPEQNGLLTNLRVTGARDGLTIDKQTSKESLFTARQIEIEAATGIGIIVTHGASARFEELVIREMQPGATGEYGQGIAVDHGAKVTVRQAVLNHSWQQGVAIQPSVESSAAEVTLEDIVISDTQPRPSDQLTGYGVLAANGALVRLTRALLERNHDISILSTRQAGALTTQLVLEDVIVRDTLVATPNTNLDSGLGLGVGCGSSAELTRAVFEENKTSAIRVDDQCRDKPSTAKIMSLVVQQTGTRPGTGKRGRGLEIHAGARVELEQAYFFENHEMGVLVDGRGKDRPSELAASQLIVERTQSNGDGRYGRGLQVSNGAQATVKNALLAGNREASVLVISDPGKPAAKLALEHATVTGTLAAACASIKGGEPGSCVAGGVQGGGGSGMVAIGGEITLDHFEIGENTLCGLLLARGGGITAQGGSVHHNPIGVNLLVEGFDINRLTNPTVAYYANENNVQSVNLPLPQ